LGATFNAYLTPDEEPDGYKCFRLFVPSGMEWEALVRGALASLLDFTKWQAFGSVSVEDTLAYFNEAIFQTFKWRSCMEIGSIFWWAGATDAFPENCLMCNGACYDQSEYPELYAVIGQVYGAGGVDQFCVPDLLRKFIQGYGIPEFPGDTGGEAEHTLTLDETPAHSHTVDSHLHTIPVEPFALRPASAGVPVPVASPGVGATGYASPGTDSKGGGQSHENRPPYLCLTPLIVAK
jgi:microcystin-dependent protein